MIHLDLGCGNKKTQGALGVDQFPLEQVDLVMDLRAIPWPIRNGSVDRLTCNHILEHMRVEKRVEFLGEIHRILKPDGIAVVRIPHGACRNARLDPTHVDIHSLHLEMFDYYEPTHRFGYYFRTPFRIVEKRLDKSVLALPNLFGLRSLLDRLLRRAAMRWEYVLWLVPLKSAVVSFKLAKWEDGAEGRQA